MDESFLNYCWLMKKAITNILFDLQNFYNLARNIAKIENKVDKIYNKVPPCA